MISTRSDDPRLIITQITDPYLIRMEVGIQNTQVILHLMTTQYLQGYNQGIVDEIIIHGSMNDMNGSVIRASGHKRIILVELDSTNRLLMITKCFKRSGRKIQVKPGEASIIRANNDIITGRMNLYLTDRFIRTSMEETHLTPVFKRLISVCFTRL